MECLPVDGTRHEVVFVDQRHRVHTARVQWCVEDEMGVFEHFEEAAGAVGAAACEHPRPDEHVQLFDGGRVPVQGVHDAHLVQIPDLVSRMCSCIKQ